MTALGLRQLAQFTSELNPFVSCSFHPTDSFTLSVTASSDSAYITHDDKNITEVISGQCASMLSRSRSIASPPGRLPLSTCCCCPCRCCCRSRLLQHQLRSQPVASSIDDSAKPGRRILAAQQLQRPHHWPSLDCERTDWWRRSPTHLRQPGEHFWWGAMRGVKRKLARRRKHPTTSAAMVISSPVVWWNAVVLFSWRSLC